MEFRILGPLEVVDDGRTVPLAGSKQRVLLSLLVMQANRLVSADRLIEDVWEGRPPESASKALQAYISQLRKAIGGDRIETQGRGYRLRIQPDEVDASRFERTLDSARTLSPDVAAATLRDALALWRGDPLQDLADHQSARVEIARLEDLRLTASERCAEAELELGRHLE